MEAATGRGLDRAGALAILCRWMPASLELVKIALKAYGDGDCEIALALAGPHIRWDERASRPDGDLVWGQSDVARAMRRYLDGWREYRFELEEVAEAGPGTVVGICRERGRTKEGTAVDRRYGGLWVVEDSKIVSWATYLTPREAVRAAKELLAGKRLQPRTAAEAKAPAVEAAPAEAEAPGAPPEPRERPRKKALTKSEEQKRAARARAKLRRRFSKSA